MLTIIAFIIVLGVLVLVHELGHFLTAKAAGIAVPRFSIGLGPKVWGFRAGDTEYVISALPLGGYVRMAGMGEEEAFDTIEGGPMDGPEVPPEQRFDMKPLGVRTIVISAGVIMNFLFAVVAFAGLAYWQLGLRPAVGQVEPDTPAAEAGLLPGDRVQRIDGEPIARWAELVEYVRARPGDTIDLHVLRDGRTIELRAGVARVMQVDSLRGDTLAFGQLGIRVDDGAFRPPGIGTGLRSMEAGLRETVMLSGLIVEYVWQLITGQASARDLGGPILIGQLSGEAARAGIGALIRFMAILSVHLAILNLLPIPILDGGQLMFLAVEGVRGRALSIESRIRLSQVGFILILALMVWVITNDVLRIAAQ